MGKIKSGIFGGVSGKVGNLTGSSWKGIPVVKSRPQSVAYPATTGQVAQTTKMSAIVAFCKVILSSWIKPLWDRAAVQMSGYNAFVRANIAEFEDGVIDDYSKLVMSQGTMAPTVAIDWNLTAGATGCTIEWDNTQISGLQLPSDVAYALVINATSGEIAVASGYPRSGAELPINFATPLAKDDVCHCYLAFKRANGTVISSSSYSEVIVPVV